MTHVGTEIDESLTGPFDTITCAEQVIRAAPAIANNKIRFVRLMERILRSDPGLGFCLD